MQFNAQIVQGSGSVLKLGACSIATACQQVAHTLPSVYARKNNLIQARVRSDVSVKGGRFDFSVKLAPKDAPPGLKLATFAGGCFWGIELAYQRVPGVTNTSVGYTGGNTPNPTYESVCSGITGHTEAIQVTYDPKEVTYGQLLDVFFERVDVTQKDGQGNDRGTQYRSGIYWHDEEQRDEAKERLEAVQQKLDEGNKCLLGRMMGKKVHTELYMCGNYYLAEDYHQQYLSKGGRSGSRQSAAKGCKDPIRCYG